MGEFQFVASRWDASQGRSNGVLVNAITKSGTNRFTGAVSARFRDDRFSADDYVLGRRIDYANHQAAVAFGGPILRDRAHFFAFYDREREPNVVTFTTPYPRFNLEQSGTIKDWNGGIRLDYQVRPEIHLMARGNMWEKNTPNTFPSTNTAHPSGQGARRERSDSLYMTFSHVLSNRALNEIKGGYASVFWEVGSSVHWGAAHPAAAQGVEFGAPRINFNGFFIGVSNTNWPQTLMQETYSIRDDFSYSFTASGRHDFRAGGELLKMPITRHNCRPCMGIYDLANSRPPANVEDLFPVWDDPTTWNLNALNPLIRNFSIGVGDFRGKLNRRKAIAGWVQDDWQILPTLTLNLGLRYDLETEVVANDLAIPPILEANRPDDRNNWGPRAGFAWSVTERTVIRGGVGKYFGTIIDNISSATISASKIFAAQITNDGRPDFATNPFNGPMPSFDELVRVEPVADGVDGHRRSERRDAVQLDVHDRRPAPDRNVDGRDRGLQLQRGAQRACRPAERQRELRPGDRPQLSVLRRQPASDSRLGHDHHGDHAGALELSRARNVVHQAHEQQLPVVRDLQLRVPEG